MTDSPPTPKKVKLDEDDVENMTKDDLLEKFKEQDKYIKFLEEKQKLRTSEGGDDFEMKESEEKLKQQHIEAARRENTLVLRLTTKEQELQDYLNQIQEFKAAQTPSTNQLRSMLLDPAINLVFQHMAKEMEECKERQKQTQNELSAWKFTADSQTGKRLMAKCRMLLQENEDLGKLIASGRTAKLEGEIALEKTLVQEMKKNQADLDEFLAEIDEDVEGMQSMIYFLQQQLKESKEQISQLKEENKQLKDSADKPGPSEVVTAATASTTTSTTTITANSNSQSSPKPSQETAASSSGANQTVDSPENIHSQSIKNIVVPTEDVSKSDNGSAPTSKSNSEKADSNKNTDANSIIPQSEECTVKNTPMNEETPEAQNVSENQENLPAEKCEVNSPVPLSDQPTSNVEKSPNNGGEESTQIVSSPPSEKNNNHTPPPGNSDVSNEAWSPKNQSAEKCPEVVTAAEIEPSSDNVTIPTAESSDTKKRTSSDNLDSTDDNKNENSTSSTVNNGTVTTNTEVENEN